jgi:hypothetical protein
MATARFRIGTAATNTAGTSWSWRGYDTAADVAAASYVKLQLESNTGVGSVSYSVFSADSTTLAAGLPTVTTVQATKTATFRAATATSRTYLVRCSINSGQTALGDSVSDYTKELAVHRLDSNGLRVVAVGETDQAHRTYGYEPKINAAIRNLAGSSYQTYVASSSGETLASFCSATVATQAASWFTARVIAVTPAGSLQDDGHYEIVTYNAAGSAAVNVKTVVTMNNDVPGFVTYAVSTANVVTLKLRQATGATGGQAVAWYCFVSSYSTTSFVPPSA